MINRLLAWLAFAILCGFVGILAIKVQRFDLSVIVGLTLLLAFWDTARATSRQKRD